VVGDRNPNDSASVPNRSQESAPPPEEEPVTAREEADEPAGDEEPGNEAEREVATERAEEEEPAAEDPEVALKRERDEYLALAQRAQADFENYRKRAAKEAAAAGERAKSGLVRELLPVVDNLERALGSVEDDDVAEGLLLVHSELIGVLERNGVQPFDPAGERFDPEWHEALSTREADGSEPGLVLDVVEKGYKSNGTVVRPARVVVSG